MSKGVLLFAFNNADINYIKQAVFCAKRVREYLDLPTSLVTDIELNQSDRQFFDKVISCNKEFVYSTKTYRNGTDRKSLSFKNIARIMSYDYSPYDETIVLDTDIIICNDQYNKCFQQNRDILLYSNALDIAGYRDYSEFDWISDAGCKFYWATCIFFRKTVKSKIFFDLLKHLHENWNHYNFTYQIGSSVFRNDHCFSIAVHILNNNMPGNYIGEFPGTLYYSTDKDHVKKIAGEDILVYAEKQNMNGSYFPIKTKGLNVHCMNKYSLEALL